MLGGFGDMVLDASDDLIADARATGEAWHDEAGAVLVDRITANAGQWVKVDGRAQALSSVAARYATVIVTVKRIITNTIAHNDEAYLRLLHGPNPGPSLARDLARGIADALWQIVSGERPAHGGVGDFLSGVGAALANGVGHAVNGLASIGNAMLHHPLDTASMVGGIALATLGAGGEVGGVALDLTGAGAVVGVPANIASAGVIAAGVGTAAAGAGDILSHASRDDRVEPMRTDHQGSGGESTAARDIHGKLRISEREIDVNEVKQDGDLYVQDDGQMVRVLDRGGGRSDVVIYDPGNPSGEPTTVINMSNSSVARRVDQGRWE
ncbi:hypothetical protein Lfu02_02550 [Longispora fulva]|nr:hypothetical protein Lfu02_02550 [Longispora fulva]